MRANARTNTPDASTPSQTGSKPTATRVAAPQSSPTSTASSHTSTHGFFVSLASIRLVRVLMLSWEYPPVMYGGLGRHAHALAESLAAAGHNVTVGSQHAVDAAYDEVVNDVRVARAPADPPMVPQDDLLA